MVSETDGSFLSQNSVVATRLLVQRDGLGIGLSQTLVARAQDSEAIAQPAALIEITS